MARQYTRKIPDEAEPKPSFRDVSYNKKIKQSSAGATIDPYAIPRLIRIRADDYFRDTAYPTFTGLALALGFTSVSKWEIAVKDHAVFVAKNGAENVKDYADRLAAWELARSRVQMHYEEGIQSQTIPAQVGKFVLEVLGFQPAQVTSAEVSGAHAAAEATRAGFAMGAGLFAGKKGSSLADDVIAASPSTKKYDS